MGMGASQTTDENKTTTPWAPQAAALETAFNGANGALAQASTAKAPTDFTAQFTPDQLATFKSMLGYANGNPLPGQTANAATTNMANGTSATSGALTGLQNYNPSASNNVDAITAAANKYVQGQNIPAQVAQATQQANETARDVTLPQISQNAAINGNTNSSRTGIAEGLVQRGLAENAQNMTGALTSQAYANGLNLAENQANQNNGAALTALTNQGTLGNAATNSGVSAGTSSINNQTGLYNIAASAGKGEQDANQANLTNQQQQYQSAVSSPFDALRQYMGIVGSNNWGSNSTGTSTQTSTPSAFQVIGGLLGTAGALF
ncbi:MULTISPECIES: hypothetical protein [unclassified Bradyrhizobium]|uniref:hypothetical protein n=1 Tax=unclassified Bradyrhizobium TaxID=2631580 RepID=UPI0029167FD8|nr:MULTISPECIES: hypothetical protein [unclassified Bradyrhizobium]